MRSETHHGAAPRLVSAGAPAPTVVPNAATTPAGDLRARLTRLLQANADLTVAAVAAGARTVQGAAGSAVRRSTADLTAAVRDGFGADAAATFQQLWTRRIGYLFDYAHAKRAGDQSAQQRAVRNLADYRSGFDKLLDGVTTAPDVKVDVIVTHDVRTVLDALDAIAAGSPEAVDKANTAARTTGSLAEILAVGYADRFPRDSVGDPEIDGAALRARLTDLLVQHVALAADAVRALTATRQPDDDHVRAAQHALVQNTQQLRNEFSQVWGERAGQRFDQLWHTHIDQLGGYTLASVRNDQPSKNEIRAQLAAWPARFAAFLADITSGAAARAQAEPVFAAHLHDVSQYIDAATVGNTALAPGRLYDALRQMGAGAQLLAAAAATQFPTRYGSGYPGR